jgi:hypothetical protein
LTTAFVDDAANRTAYREAPVRKVKRNKGKVSPGNLPADNQRSIVCPTLLSVNLRSLSVNPKLKAAMVDAAITFPT